MAAKFYEELLRLQHQPSQGGKDFMTSPGHSPPSSTSPMLYSRCLSPVLQTRLAPRASSPGEAFRDCTDLSSSGTRNREYPSFERLEEAVKTLERRVTTLTKERDEQLAKPAVTIAQQSLIDSMQVQIRNQGNVIADVVRKVSHLEQALRIPHLNDALARFDSIEHQLLEQSSISDEIQRAIREFSEPELREHVNLLDGKVKALDEVCTLHRHSIDSADVKLLTLEEQSASIRECLRMEMDQTRFLEMEPTNSEPVDSFPNALEPNQLSELIHYGMDQASPELQVELTKFQPFANVVTSQRNLVKLPQLH